MASDLFEYKGTYEGSLVMVSYLDYPREHPNTKGIYSMRIFEDDEWFYLSQEDEDKISEGVALGKIPLEYLGGWCPSGWVWGADGYAIEVGGD